MSAAVSNAGAERSCTTDIGYSINRFIKQHIVHDFSPKTG